MEEEIIVVGAGVAGLTAALALARKGRAVRVVERAAERADLGAGLQLSPNGTRVFIDLGLEAQLQAVVSETAGKAIRHWSTGQTWKLFDLGQACRERYGAPYWMVHRGDLQRILSQAVREAGVDIQIGADATGYRLAGSGAEVEFADGSRMAAPAVIAADGIHSRLRRRMTGEDRAAFTGIMAWRGVAPAERLPQAMRANIGLNWVGPHRHVVVYPINAGRLINFVGVVERDDWRTESWTEAGSLEECRRDFEGWHEDVHRLIGAIDQHYRWALLSRPPLQRCTDGAVALIGDAFHPTLPFLAQGANMAIEDAAVIARCLTHYPSAAEAFAAFQAMRMERTASIVEKSADQAKRFHNPAYVRAETAADLIAEEWRPDRVADRYEWLFRYDPLTTPLP